MQIVDDLEKFISKSLPGKSEDAIKYIRRRLLVLDVGLRMDLKIDRLMSWAEIFYSSRKWQGWGGDKVRSLMFEEAERIRMRIAEAPDSLFE